MEAPLRSYPLWGDYRKPVFPNPRAADRCRSVDQSAPGRPRNFKSFHCGGRPRRRALQSKQAGHCKIIKHLPVRGDKKVGEHCRKPPMMSTAWALQLRPKSRIPNPALYNFLTPLIEGQELLKDLLVILGDLCSHSDSCEFIGFVPS
ncbi:hypothetical protein NDU88_008262 [Pleurodeles waltl]|uniref:Uncharacterized protein n=1 Tax=Pleurodeles waltl TaxID=8319 RepID=A0AAV7N4F8_PLEWA|nr:hypothetical protein NDU88_008262 [Pleurodeles waltl]